MRSSRKRAVDGFLRAFSGVDARSIGRECRSFRAFETSRAFCLSKTSKPLTTHHSSLPSRTPQSAPRPPPAANLAS